jgi:nitrate reductase assembly molybdenum cofactor insertion protein NarJ
MTGSFDRETRALLAEAAEWRLLSLLFACPGADWRRHLSNVAEDVEDAGLRSCARLALDQAAEGLYHWAAGPGGPLAPREVSHCDSLELGYLMSELETYYSSFGYHPQAGEAPDHISVEAGFLSFLRMKEAFARASGDLERAAVTSEAATSFQRDHLARIARPLADHLTESGLEYLADAARALLARVGTLPDREPPSFTGLRVLQEESVFSCGDSGFGDPTGQ